MSKVKPAPVVQTAPATGGHARPIRTVLAILVSVGTHGLLLALFLLVTANLPATAEIEQNVFAGQLLTADPEDALPREPFDMEVDPSGLNMGGVIISEHERKAEATVPGRDDPREKIGARDGDDANPLISFPSRPGVGLGNGGALIPGVGPSVTGPPGGGSWGTNPFAQRLKLGDAGGTRDIAGMMGATTASAAAVARGLKWLERHQAPDGRWLLDGAFRDKGAPNDTAGTALGLLPFLGAGKTHRAARDNPYDKTVAKGLRALSSRQDLKRGDLGGGMYGHGIATIALSEAYGLTQDPNLRVVAQRAVNFIVYAQHDKGGWRYAPGQEGDLSVTGWQIMALKSAQMAGLDVPPSTLKKAERFLASLASPTTEGYGYTDSNSTSTMSAVGLLCREFMQGWGPQNPRLIKGISANIKPIPPGAKKDAYYHYYATQVMYHFGGEAWKNWNEQMREHLIKSQADNQASPDLGSWSSAGDTHAAAGGRLMVTSLNLLTLEVYYRYLPLYYRDAGMKL